MRMGGCGYTVSEATIRIAQMQNLSHSFLRIDDVDLVHIITLVSSPRVFDNESDTAKVIVDGGRETLVVVPPEVQG